VSDRLSTHNPHPAMTDLLTSPLRAGRHLAIWVVWHSVGVSLLPPDDEE
jgi:hypothetical protein